MLAELLVALCLAPAPRGIAPGQAVAPPIRLVAGHRLVQQADGSWSNLDRRHGFVARIAPDGQLHFDGIDYGAGPTHPWAAMPRDPITGDPARGRPPNLSANQAGTAIGALITAGIFKGLEVRGDRRHQRPGVMEPLDPRARFSLDTAQFRAQLATEWFDAQLQRAIEQLDADLRGLWSDAISPKARRLAVFELWNRLEDRLPPVPLHPPPDVRRQLETNRAEAGVEGREAVFAFIRTYLPRGTKEGYGRIELRRLEQRRLGHLPFAPYEPSTAAK